MMGKVVDFDSARDQLYPFDFTIANKELTNDILADTALFSQWVTDKLQQHHCRYGIGGYNEHRTIYQRSAYFDAGAEPRRLHLGIDIWGPAGTAVYNFYEAEVHSFKFNGNFGDYGATIILKYHIGPVVFYGLYGHLDLLSIKDLKEGQVISGGRHFANFGSSEENGHWPPHLHFQLIYDMQGMKGDYPGVCKYSERAVYLKNCPDPNAILKGTFGSSLG